jgi:ABC-2 type transport system ATP-binding protein
MTSWWDKKVEELSKGMQQKVQFIVTILHEPELLIFDEPFSGFDPINANLLKQEILALKKKGATIIFSTHNMASVEEICDHIALINKSKKILDGPVEQIRQQFKANLFELSYTGDFEKAGQILEASVNMVEHRPIHHAYYLKGELKEGKNYTELLKDLLSEVHITQFNEILPEWMIFLLKLLKTPNKPNDYEQDNYNYRTRIYLTG